MRALHAMMLTLLVMAGWHLQAAARIVAEAPADVMTDPQAALPDPQAVQAVDPQLAVADLATPATVDPQLITTEPAYQEVLAVAPGQADMPAPQLDADDASVNVMTRWPWTRKPPPPGLGGTAGGKSTYCGAMAPQGGCDPTVTLGQNSITCSVKPTKYSSADNRFLPSDFQHSCLGDAAVHCADKANTVDPKTISPASSCCSCYLYSQIASKQFTPVKSKAGNNYVLSKPANPSLWHLMVMPQAACSGVENWHVNQQPWSQCPGEDIWDAAQEVIDGGVQVPCVSDRFLWGMAINPVSRRGQHQMHVHVAQVYPELLASVAGLAGLVRSQITPTTPMELDCGLVAMQSGTTRLRKCQMAATKKSTNLEVTIVSGISTAAGATPFETTYTKTPDNTKKAKIALRGSTLVLRVPWTRDSWAVVVNIEGPAECFFNPQPNRNSPPDCDLVKACQTLPDDCALYRPCNPSPKSAPECNTWRTNKCLYQPTVDCTLLQPCFDSTIQDDCNAYSKGQCTFPKPPKQGAKC